MESSLAFFVFHLNHRPSLLCPAIHMLDEFEPWRKEGDKAVLELCHPDLVEMHRVSKRVNSPANDEAGLIEAVSQ